MQIELAKTYETQVPQPFGPPVRDMVRDWCVEVLDDLTSHDFAYHGKVEEVENRHRSGFIPYTDGGFDGIAYADMGNAIGSGNVPHAIQPYVDQSQKNCEKAWNEENPEHPIEYIYGDDLEDAGQHYLFTRSKERETWRERFYEFENEYHSEGGTYFYKVRALFYDAGHSQNKTGEPEVYFFVGINTDFEYGRDHIEWLSVYGGNPQCTKWVWEQNTPVSQITPELMAQFAENAFAALCEKA